ncbi:TonB-dependent receptor [Solimicrobium silvestre]|uniref:TonB dependent receptor n=1 Tax=Solimicrobium silvestre TaxID=2099400 RepID=A0A2S9H089_9BURK|nr:TonB-dependent receptor [Solimicrobium silvestre]PRC93391.1 TonB dependent receptor [Solimicrobium silvestre]
MANRQFNFICAAAVASTFASTFICAPTWAQEVAQTTAAPAASAPASTETPDSTATPAPTSVKNSNQIQTVIITANKRKEDASKVPLSISVIGGDELAAQHIEDFASATRSIPNISFSGGGGGGNAGNGPGLSNVEMRGISSEAGSATVGIYLDDVSMTVGNLYSMGSAEPKFFDLDHIEVLRGPQGTLYGASSMGGTVKFISNQPNLKIQETNISADVSSTAGGGTNNTETGVFNAVLIPNELALRIGVESAHKSGFINQVNPTTAAVIANGINWEDDRVARIAMKWMPTKDLSITPSVFYQQVNTGDIDVSYLTLLNGTPIPKNETAKLVREPGKDTMVVPSLTINYSMDVGDITSVTSYFKRNFNRTQDGTTVNSVYLGSQVQNDPALASVVGALPSAVFLNNEVTQFSQEVRIASKPYDQSVSPFTWVAGAYVSNMNTNITDNEPVYGINAAFNAAGMNPSNPADLAGTVTAGFPNDNSYFAHRAYHDTQQAVFGEANYYFIPTVHATAGLRFLEAKETFSRAAGLYFANDGTNDGNAYNVQDSSGSKATPKFAITWEVDKTDTLYATAAEGFRVGGSNFPLPMGYCGMTTPNPLSFGADTLWSYEVGDKSRFLDNTLSVNADLFYIDWKNLQQQITLANCGYAYNTNVGSATSYGGEIEVKYKPISSVVLDLAGGYTHATLSDDAGLNAGVVGAVKGADVPGVPKFNLALTGQYNFAINDDVMGFVRTAAHWTGTSNGTLAPSNPDYQRPAYANVDASTGVSFEKWDVSLYVRNIANSQKIIQRPQVQGTADEAYRMSPRTIGVTLTGKL